METALLVGHDAFGEVVLVRHGQQGRNDLNDPLRPKAGDAALSALGEIQAEAVADELADQKVEAIYCSDLLRASSTARAIARRHHQEPIVDPALREIAVYRDVPAGRTVNDEIGPEGVAEIRRQFLTHRRWDAFPMSESSQELAGRLRPAMDRILAAHPEDSRVVVVVHGGVINSIVRSVLGVDADMFFYPAHASVSRLARGMGRLGVVTLNEQQHLRRFPGSRVTY
jgi:broad specificity phosphatase PhoE